MFQNTLVLISRHFDLSGLKITIFSKTTRLSTINMHFVITNLNRNTLDNRIQ